MFYPELAVGVKHFKETEGGRKIMCEAVEEYANKQAQEAAKVATEVEKENLALKMLKAGKYELEEIASLTELPVEQVKLLEKNL
jgi:molybdopterin/thiamine biosynthesis adenylyltransferase